MDGMLSQDEINALLSGMNTGGDDTSDSSTATTTIPEDNANDNTDGGFTLTESEKDAVGEISNISMGTAATTLSSLLSQKVNITTPKVEVATWDDLSSKYDRPCVMLQISYKEGLAGNNVLILRENDVKIITDLMMGGPGDVDPDEPLTELHLSAIGEAMNQMMGSAATSLSSMFNRKIDISPPIANLVETYNELDDNLPGFLKNHFVMVAFKMQIGELIDSEIMQLYPKEFAQELLNMFMPSAEPEQPQVSQEDTANHQEEQVQQAPAQNMTQTMPQQVYRCRILQHRQHHNRECRCRIWECLMVMECRCKVCLCKVCLCRVCQWQGMHQHRMLMYLQQHFSHFQQMSIL